MSENEVAAASAAASSESPKGESLSAEASAPAKRRPGRPRKVKVEDAAAPTEEKPKRRPGRPRKNPVADASASATGKAEADKAAAPEGSAEEKPKRRPGRPRKNPLPEAVDGEQKPTASRESAKKIVEDASDRVEEPEKSSDSSGQVEKSRAKAVQTEDSSQEGGAPAKTTVHVRRSRGEHGDAEQKTSDKNYSGHHKDRANNQKQFQQKRNNDRKQRRGRNQQNREIAPSVNREELAALKVAELREKAVELGLDATGLKKAQLVDAVYEASAKAEGFIEVAGILDIMPDGYGFLRTQGYLPSESDAYVGLSMIRRNGLRKGDMVCGQTRPARENEKYAAIQKLISVNGKVPEECSHRPKFSDLTPVYPDERLLMEHGKSTITARVIDLAAPIGKGQRGLIVSPPKAGKTTILKDIAASITANNPEVHLMCLLVDERPEEVTDMERSVRGEVISSTFDMPCENHIAVSELVIERAKRLVEMGEDVVILLDSITRLARAYNLAQPASGRILSGGVDSTALYPPKRFLGAARNIEGGGSLTILASALIDTGSKMDEVIFEEFKGTGNMELKLDRNLADRRIFPAIDPVTSGTRKEDLLLDSQEAPLIWAVRRILSNMNSTERAMDMLIKSLKRTETNQEFLLRTAKKAQSAHGKAEEGFEL